MTALYSNRFKELLDNFKGTARENYIGQGNPGAKILIIGKETTTTEDDDPYHYKIETLNNFRNWQENFKNKTDFSDVYDWALVPKDEQEKFYNPLYPYNSNHIGWSKTWDGYQKIINHIFPESAAHKGEPYNFWQHCFITELSTFNKKTSGRDFDPETNSSINARLFSPNGILRQKFFQQFPIIILACYHYKDTYKIDIETSFNQQFVKTIYNEKNDGVWEFIHKHFKDNRLLLHTNHAIKFTGNGLHSDKYYDTLGHLCRDFLASL